MVSSDRDTLLGMGFEPARVEWALKVTGGRGLQPAMDHVFENEGKPVPDLSSAVEEPARRTGGAGAGAMDMDEDDEEAESLRAALKLSKGEAHAEGSAGAHTAARSIMCSECKKIFRNTDDANFHATKSGHDQFEESTEEKKPLTEEEKTQKLAELREKMAAKRAVKSQQDSAEQRANEAIRRKAGQDAGRIAEDLKMKQIQKEADQKKREKAEDARARAAIKEQIEADKRARAERTAREKALRDGQPITDASAAPSAAPVAAAVAPSGTAGRDFKDTRLQIRLASGGAPLTTTLPSDSPLRAVAEFVAGQSLAHDVDSVTFTQQFPRKTFGQADMSKSLRDLGLTPSAVLIAS